MESNTFSHNQHIFKFLRITSKIINQLSLRYVYKYTHMCTKVKAVPNKINYSILSSTPNAHCPEVNHFFQIMFCIQTF